MNRPELESLMKYISCHGPTLDFRDVFSEYNAVNELPEGLFDIKTGIDLNIIDGRGIPLFMFMFEKYRYDALRVIDLQRSDIDLTSTDTQGRNILLHLYYNILFIDSFGIDESVIKLLKMFIEYGVDIHEKDVSFISFYEIIKIETEYIYDLEDTDEHVYTKRMKTLLKFMDEMDNVNLLIKPAKR